MTSSSRSTAPIRINGDIPVEISTSFIPATGMPATTLISTSSTRPFANGSTFTAEGYLSTRAISLAQVYSGLIIVQPKFPFAVKARLHTRVPDPGDCMTALSFLPVRQHTHVHFIACGSRYKKIGRSNACFHQYFCAYAVAPDALYIQVFVCFSQGFLIFIYNRNVIVFLG